ncbi:unnamed protein product [Brassica oleracea]
MVVIISVNFYKTFILADCDQYFKKSLFFVGEIGGNDYNYPLLAFRSYKHAIDLVPSVINKIINVTSALIEEGAVTLVVPGNLPIGCSAVLLERFSDDIDGSMTQGIIVLSAAEQYCQASQC